MIRFVLALLITAATCVSSRPAERDRVEGSERRPQASQAGASGQVVVELTVAERTVLRAFHSALESASVREAGLEHVLEQLERNPPVAFVDGYWASPVDLSELLGDQAVVDEVLRALPVGPAGEEASALLADRGRLRQLAAVAFTSRSMGSRAGVRYVGALERTTQAEAEATGVFVVPAQDTEWSLVEYMPPAADPGTEPQCYFFCGDPETWDFDGDGDADPRDDDDDNDGVPDARDDYPYWPGGHACRCEADVFVALVTKFAPAITRTVVAARSLFAGLDQTSRGVTLGVLPGSDSAVQFVFPASLLPSEQRPGAQDCPSADDPGVTFLSTDPNHCAAMRFRCAEGEVPFSNGCGCGCRVSGADPT